MLHQYSPKKMIENAQTRRVGYVFIYRTPMDLILNLAQELTRVSPDHWISFCLKNYRRRGA
ncbi:Uncharacterised protein [Mycobacteroides abscessus]|nr:Uncharacterised protein [Mycobacteroides abscessus]CPS62282.1 Uncharacterised protein [Mycobacteroides abscessus]CPY44617.1 Uncharacterised protein [Mycobacteroides abscessus]CPY52428.1 Uncharacterised protein [Mycobacteroides abscessus]SLI81179.1 Uncharacterised protein [Mycobacteroides abscessus subsp. abscessus]